MSEPAGRTELSQGSHTRGAYGSNAPPTNERGMELPHRVAAAIRCLGVATSILNNLSVASMYDKRIDSSSAGVAEVAGRLIDEAITTLDPSLATKSSAMGAPT